MAMLDWLQSLFISGLAAYLTVTNVAAERISSLWPSEPTPTIISEPITPPTEPQASTERYVFGGNIPRILVEATEADKLSAAVITATTTNPAIAPAVAAAMVNIYCTYETDRYQKTTTGTGFFISERGIILTNAHVAQFLLLEGLVGESQCVIRTGNPAVAQYQANLLYIPPVWVQEHADLINARLPQGTGERDYALLYITADLSGNPVSHSFPHLPLHTDLIRTSILNQPLFAAGYPATNLNVAGSNLTPQIATTSVRELMTFGSQYADIASLRGSSVGEQGSSGGPVINRAGEVIGLITTRGDDDQFGTGSLRALTLSYIDRTIKSETGFDLDQNVRGDLPYRAAIFRQALIPLLQQLLAAGLSE